LKTHFPAAKRFKELENNTVRVLRRLRPRRDERPSPAKAVQISEETRAKLTALLADDVRRLRGYLGADFDGWGIA
jgi:hypothetical protein